MVAEDVSLIINLQEELQKLFDTYTKCADRNRLHWKLAKCTVEKENEDELTSPVTISRQVLRTNTEAKYLGVIVKTTGFTKVTNSETENKCKITSSVITSQLFFGPKIPVNTLRTLYHTNVRGILLYGAAVKNHTE